MCRRHVVRYRVRQIHRCGCGDHRQRRKKQTEYHLIPYPLCITINNNQYGTSFNHESQQPIPVVLSSFNMWTTRCMPLMRSLRRSTPLTSRRTLAGHGHGPTPPAPQSDQAVLFDGYHYGEGWELTIAWAYTTSFLLIVAVIGWAPDTEITHWAYNEAHARLALASEDDNGSVTVPFGTHVQNDAKK
jgi:hypothetical protein